MIRIDRKVCRDILKLTNSYDDQIIYDPDLKGFALWSGSFPGQVSTPSVEPAEILGSLNRLCENKFLVMQTGVHRGGMIFSITPELRHRNAFWFDRVSKTYAGGFVSGVLTSVVAGTILHFIGLL